MIKPENDPVNHPSHYTSDPSGIECIQITRHRNFNIGNAIKYLWRAGLKSGAPTEQELDKAIWYIKDEKERLFGGETEEKFAYCPVCNKPINFHDFNIVTYISRVDQRTKKYFCDMECFRKLSGLK